MNGELWLRRAAMAAIPAIGVTLWALSRRSPPPMATPGEPASRAAVAAASTTPAPTIDAAFLNGERALAARELGSAAEAREAAPREPARPPEPAFTPEPAPARFASRPRAAVELPVATGDAPALAPRGSAPHRQTPHRSSEGSLCGGLTVRLITATDDPEWSFASIAPSADAEAGVRRVGDTVGGWRVTGIDWDRVWVERGGSRCAVGMHVGAREAETAVAGRADELLAPAGDAPTWLVPEAIAQALDKRSETELEVGADAVALIYDQAAALFSGVRFAPVRREEVVVGLALREVPADSLLDRLGLERDDVVLALNDAPCSTLASTLDALTSAREQGALVARLERAGERFELSVRVR